MSGITLSFKEKASLFLQQGIAFILYPVLYGGVFIYLKGRGYRINNLKKVRARYRALQAELKGPLLICANHLTFIDSLLIAWALAGPLWYFFHFKRFAWNLPKRVNVQACKLYQLVCYLGKCLLISPQGDSAKATLNQTAYLLQKGHVFLIFPEGTRSKTGRVNRDNLAYGVGSLKQKLGDLNILSIYMRGEKQVVRTKLPEKNQSFTLVFQPLAPHTDKKGLKGQREIALQIVESLEQMEADYFKEHARQ